mgnify:CR=1 FL=1
MTGYCGYWMYGMAYDSQLGWLCYEHKGEASISEVESSIAYGGALELWRAGLALPEGYYLLDSAAAIKAYGEGVKRYGAHWYDDADASMYDVVIQMALLGEVKYG